MGLSQAYGTEEGNDSYRENVALSQQETFSHIAVNIRHLTGWPIDRLAECATHNPLKFIIRKAVRMFGEVGNALAISDPTESQYDNLV